MTGFFHIVKSELLYNTNIYFVDFIQHSFTAVQYFLFILLNIVLLQEPWQLSRYSAGLQAGQSGF
jgi:hypothetical protein